jgi:hypothetical protein
MIWSLIATLVYGASCGEYYIRLAFGQREIPWSTRLLPLHWKLSGAPNVPIDLIFAHFVMPAFIHLAFSGSAYKNVWHFFFLRYSSLLRLKSFLFGGRWLSDEVDCPLHPSMLSLSYPRTTDDVFDPSLHGILVHSLAQDDLVRDQTLRIILGIERIPNAAISKLDPATSVILERTSIEITDGVCATRNIGKISRRNQQGSVLSLASWQDPLVSPTILEEYEKENGKIYVPREHCAIADSDSRYALEPTLSVRPDPPVTTSKVRLAPSQSTKYALLYTRDMTRLVRAYIGSNIKSCVVFRPPRMCLRVVVFMAWLLVTAAAGHGLLFFGSVLLGRQFVGFFLHDGYALLVGFCVLMLMTKYARKAWHRFDAFILMHFQSRKLMKKVLEQQHRKLMISSRQQETQPLMLPLEVSVQAYMNAAVRSNLLRPEIIEKFRNLIASINTKMAENPISNTEIFTKLVDESMREIRSGDSFASFAKYGADQLLHISRTLCYFLYLSVWLIVIIPTFVGTCMEMVLAHASRTLFSGYLLKENTDRLNLPNIAGINIMDQQISVIPTYRLFEDWYLGLFLLWTVWRIFDLLEANGALRRNGATRILPELALNWYRFCKQVILLDFTNFSHRDFHLWLFHCLKWIVGFLALPVTAFALTPETSKLGWVGLFILNLSPLCIVLFITAYLSISWIARDLNALVNYIREEEYRVGTVLHNLE